MKLRLWPAVYPVCILLFAALGFFSARSATPADAPEAMPAPITYYVTEGIVTAVPFSELEANAAASAAERAAQITEATQPVEADPLLILVNPWNPVPEGYIDTIVMEDIGDGYLLDSRACGDFKAMIDAMHADDLWPTVNSAYRDHETQTQLYENKLEDYESEGYTPEEAETLAAQWVAVPGTSEHEAALAVDLSMYEDTSDEVHLWLRENSWRYGFIYRYPEDKLEVTGIQPEPWHYRYVGRTHAESIYHSGLTLEEYISSIGR